MDFGDQEDHEEEEEEMGLTPSYDPAVLPNSSSRPKMSNSGGDQVCAVAAAAVVTTSSSKPRYKECMKNHAVGIGGHALDGCGDFMPAGAEGTLDALKCAACNCHRNFHRKETASESATPLPTQPPPPPPGAGGEIFFHHHHHQVPQFTPYYRTPAGYLHVAAAAGPGGGPPPLHRPLALQSTSHSREDQEDMSNPSGGGGGSSRKRFRTKFTAEQKERMLGLAERLGWRIQKHDEAVVQEFCNETGVRRHVLKVWMHNNKHTLGKKP